MSIIDRSEITLHKLSEYLTEYKELNTNNKYRPVSVGRFGIRTRESIYSKELAKDYSKNKLIYQGTLTVGMGAVQMDIGILSDDKVFSVSPAYHTYRIAGIDYDYLRYCLQCRNMDMFARYMKRGSRQGKSIDLTRWITYEIPVYPPQTQAEIIVQLDTVQRIIDARRQELAALDELIKTRFVEMFGCDRDYIVKAKHRVADICETRVGIVIQPTQYYTDDIENGVKAFRSLNVKPFYVNDADWVFFSKDSNNMLARTQVHANDVAVVRSGANLGDSCVIPAQYDGCNAIDILLLTCNSDILPLYLSAFINYPVGKNQLLNVQRGGAIKHLNLKQLEKSIIFVPSI